MAEKEMTREEMEKLNEARQKEFKDFMDSLKNDPDSPCTKAELAKAIEFIGETLQGVGELAGAAMYNVQILGHNFNTLMTAIQTGKGVSPVKKTNSGIILP